MHSHILRLDSLLFPPDESFEENIFPTQCSECICTQRPTSELCRLFSGAFATQLSTLLLPPFTTTTTTIQQQQFSRQPLFSSPHSSTTTIMFSKVLHCAVQSHFLRLPNLADMHTVFTDVQAIAHRDAETHHRKAHTHTHSLPHS